MIRNCKLLLLYLLFSYAFELCSTHNRVVRDYAGQEAVCLLAAFAADDGTELSDAELDAVVEAAKRDSSNLRIHRPTVYSLRDCNAVLAWLHTMETRDPTFEGLVAKASIAPGRYVRAKFKSSTWLMLHKSKHRAHFELTLPAVVRFLPRRQSRACVD